MKGIEKMISSMERDLQDKLKLEKALQERWNGLPFHTRMTYTKGSFTLLLGSGPDVYIEHARKLGFTRTSPLRGPKGAMLSVFEQAVVYIEVLFESSEFWLGLLDDSVKANRPMSHYMRILKKILAVS